MNANKFDVVLLCQRFGPKYHGMIVRNLTHSGNTLEITLGIQ